MKTKIFISWSGEISKQIALQLKKWIPAILQNTDAFVSDSDIEKGTRGLDRIAKELEGTTFGILCLTKDNLSSPWIYFEAGAISKSIDSSRLTPILFDAVSSDISQGNPLLQFQYAKFELDDFAKVLDSINSCCGESAISKDTIRVILTGLWPEIDKNIKQIINDAEEKKPQPEHVHSNSPEREILEEILKEVRNQNAVSASRMGIADLSPAAFRDLYRSYNELCEILEVGDEEISKEEVGIILERLHKPLAYFSRKVGRDFLGISGESAPAEKFNMRPSAADLRRRARENAVKSNQFEKTELGQAPSAMESTSKDN